MPSKQNIEFFGLVGLTEVDAEIMKAMYIWPYNVMVGSSYNIANKLGRSHSHVAARIRWLNGKGFVKKSLGGSWVLNDEIKSRIATAQATIKPQQQRCIETQDKPIENEDEFDRTMKELINDEKIIKEMEEKQKQHQRFKNMDVKIKKKINARKYNAAKQRSKDEEG